MSTPPSENLLALSLNFEQSQISITVVSKGCTVKDDFKLQLQEGQLLVLRTRKDECKAMQEPVQFTWTFKEAGIDPNKTFVIGNRFIANPFTANL